MRKSSKMKVITDPQIAGMFPLADSWDGPHFRLFRCGLNDFRETVPPISMFLDVLEPMGCWEYVQSGSIYYKVGMEQHRIDAGEALIMRRPDPGWLLRPVEDTPLKTIWLFLKDETALRMFDYLHQKYGPIQKFAANSKVVKLARQLVDLVAEEPNRPAYFWSEKTFQWLNTWWEYAQQHHFSWNVEGRAALKPATIISQTPQTVKNFAKQIGYSRSYLSRKLAQQWSCSPSIALREVRLQEAATLLRSTELSISAIATRVGYGGSAAFGRAFMQQYKLSPRAYRHTNR